MLAAYPIGGTILTAAIAGLIIGLIKAALWVFAKPKESPETEQETMNANISQKRPSSAKAIASLVLGIIGLLAWLIPLFGVPINIVGLFLGSDGLKSAKRRMASAGVVMCIIGLVLSLINAALGAYFASTGQIPAFFSESSP